MTLEQLLLNKLKQLPIDKQQELLDFADFLSQKSISKPTLTSIRGLCDDLKVDITEEEIQQLRQEMWSNFPREEL
ncbi:DUF2281 domain-containing protein [Crocosphaera sp.]|uniref:DUF2281 domain-containing protein n=1 Tax=Crocosphaera sp. TaxID=2729996 RepID=UPI0026108E99|nr:DUF2281 domain-containing protein [Crocosphaera sp.]MDJ0578499.1 DUF2281 domain-containing protein [Crocosphaera sp.]